jgi:hypothetical protein
MENLNSIKDFDYLEYLLFTKKFEVSYFPKLYWLADNVINFEFLKSSLENEKEENLKYEILNLFLSENFEFENLYKSFYKILDYSLLIRDKTKLIVDDVNFCIKVFQFYKLMYSTYHKFTNISFAKRLDKVKENHLTIFNENEKDPEKIISNCGKTSNWLFDGPSNNYYRDLMSVHYLHNLSIFLSGKTEKQIEKLNPLKYNELILNLSYRYFEILEYKKALKTIRKARFKDSKEWMIKNDFYQDYFDHFDVELRRRLNFNQLKFRIYLKIGKINKAKSILKKIRRENNTKVIFLTHLYKGIKLRNINDRKFLEFTIRPMHIIKLIEIRIDLLTFYKKNSKFYKKISLEIQDLFGILFSNYRKLFYPTEQRPLNYFMFQEYFFLIYEIIVKLHGLEINEEGKWIKK